MRLLHFYVLQTAHSCLHLSTLIPTKKRKQWEITRNRNDGTSRTNLHVHSTENRFQTTQTSSFSTSMSYIQLILVFIDRPWYQQRNASSEKSLAIETMEVVAQTYMYTGHKIDFRRLKLHLSPLLCPTNSSFLSSMIDLDTNNETQAVRNRSKSKRWN